MTSYGASSADVTLSSGYLVAVILLLAGASYSVQLVTSP